MKPVVTSIVALALAIAPLAAHAAAQAARHEAPKASRHEKTKKPGLVSVHHVTKAEKTKPVAKVERVRHAHNVDVSGPGHDEPSTKALQAVSMKKTTPAKAMRGKGLEHVSLVTPAPLPQLPAPAHVEKAEKAEKAESHKPMTKAQKEMAELVAAIRAPVKVEEKVEPKPEAKPEPAKNSGLEVVVAKTKPEIAVKTRCTKEPFEIIRGPEMEKLALTTCDGKIAPLAVEQLSVLVRPGSAARPTTPIKELAKKKGQDIAPGIRRVDERLAVKLQAVVDHFTKDGITPKVSIVSGYRPTSTGSMHATGRAVDFRLEGIKNEEVVAFCKTLDDSGCGYYPNSSFVHLDVRDAGKKTSWIDASGPGETPKYVSAWPPPKNEEQLETTSAKVVETPSEAAPESAEPTGEETTIN